MHAPLTECDEAIVRWVDLDGDDADPGAREYFGDPGSHSAKADHCDLSNLHGREITVADAAARQRLPDVGCASNVMILRCD